MIPPPADVLRAAEVARACHRWQADHTGRPYFDAHVVDVHRRVAQESTAVQAVALLHDVLGSTDCAEIELRRDFPPHVVAAVLALTRRSGEPSSEYYARVRADPIARAVKLADLAALTEPARVAGLDEATAARLAAEQRAGTAVLH
ncbi:MAG: guanosine-3,5-bis(Diphosphate) 3-diphosphatase [Modestobacter sp.]|nr:guanosine-3,5-bis(Diphosphate) 3-diphosphatase [Modestobacter sp.]